MKGRIIGSGEKTRYLIDGVEVTKAAFEAVFPDKSLTGGQFGGTPTKGWPIYSECLAVDPSDRDEHSRAAQNKGVPTETLPDGRVVLRDRAHRKQYLRISASTTNRAGTATEQAGRLSMDLTGVAAVITALSLLVPAIVKLLFDLRRLRADYAIVWRGLVARGFLEAEYLKHLTFAETCWIVSSNARSVYEPIAGKLKWLHKGLVQRLGYEPSEDVLAMGIEREFQAWMLRNACPRLRVNTHGCLAIALVIAREPETV